LRLDHVPHERSASDVQAVATHRWGAALLWAVVGTLVVHVAFYKLLRVPLPWGVLKPFY
jgi:hypothetical protein